MTARDIVVYGDVNLNILDGSATWLVSLAETLTHTDSTIHVVLKAHVTTDRLLTRIADHPRIVLHQPVTAPGMSAMSPPDAVKRLEDVVLGAGASILIVRGSQMAAACSRSDVLSARLWSYVTDFVFPAILMPPDQRLRLREVATNSQRLFVQTEETRAYIEAILPEAAGKCLLMTPTVPDDFFVDLDDRPDDDNLSLVYSGKLHPDWRTLEAVDLPARLNEAGCPATLTILGDKVQSVDPSWVARMRSALDDPPANVTWAGGVPREEALSVVARHDVGLSWRSASLDASLEISTKMLEYAASGTPPVLNRTAAHEALLGRDYPLFVEDSIESVVDVLTRARPQLPGIRVAAQQAARRYASSVTAHRLEGYFERSEPDLHVHPVRGKALNVVVASHDLKFAGELLDTLSSRSDIVLRLDKWESLRDHDESVSTDLLKWADVVICEWAGPNAVWYSQRKRPNQRLIVRLHRFELTSPWIHDIEIDQVDTLITVSQYYSDLVEKTLGCPPERVHCVPNSLDVVDLARPKHPGARYSLALVGVVPILKRPDRALDLLEALIPHDSRFRLHIKGRMPWEYPWTWNKWTEREPYLHFFKRIGSTPGLAEHVVFEPFGADMGNWLRSIGWVLSPSDLESFHLAPAEGMASGALPLFWPRDGVEAIFGTEFLKTSISDMVEFVLSHVHDDDAWRRAETSARSTAAAFDAPVVSATWLDHVFGPEDQRGAAADR